MGVIYKSNEEKELCSAYGMTVYGKVNEYEWTIYPDRKNEECLTSLRITDKNGNNLYDRSLGNRCIFKDNFGRTIDNVLYWIDRDCPDILDIEKVVENNLCSSGSIFNHLINNRKMKEKIEMERAKQYEEKRKLLAEKANRVREICDKNKLFCWMYGDDYCIVLKPLNEKSRRLLVSTDNYDTMLMYKDFAIKNPRNKDVEFIFDGTFDEFLNRF